VTAGQADAPPLRRVLAAFTDGIQRPAGRHYRHGQR
jgi:hypothetical protein